MIRYHAYHALPRRGFAEIVVEMEPGKFAQRVETLTGRVFKTVREADAAMVAANCVHSCPEGV